MRRGLFLVTIGDFVILPFLLNINISNFRDKDGRKLLIFCVYKHIKGQILMEDMKKFFVYYLERLYREEAGEQITLLFDCRFVFHYI